MMPYNLFLTDEQATLDFGKRCASLFSAPATVYLQGDLGAGKTTFVRGLLRGLGYAGAVKSPTYAVVESYVLPEITVHHFDLYRFATPDEWEDAGLDDLFDAPSLRLIEWAEQGGDYVPAADWQVRFVPQSSGRHATLMPMQVQQQQECAAWQS